MDDAHITTDDARSLYRRHEDEVLRWFLARDAKPDVAADLMAETFAAALATSRSRRSLLRCAHRVLDASCREGRVVTGARRRLGMSALVLTDASLDRIAGLRTAGPPPALRDDEDRVLVIDESDNDDRTSYLRRSEHMALGGRAGRERPGPARIPELEDALAAAASSARRGPAPRTVVVLAGAALAGVALALVTSGDDAGRPVPGGPATGTEAVAPESERTAEEQIAIRGNAWVRFFAASDAPRCVEQMMTQAACERVACRSVRGPVENCVPVQPAIQRSFRGAQVTYVVVKGDRAAARFSNGEIVEFVLVDDAGGAWSVDRVGERAGRGVYSSPPSRRQTLVRAAVSWARSSGGSFRDTLVDDVVVKSHRGAVKFSNGRVAEFVLINDVWSTDRVGGSAGRGFFRE